MGSNQLIANELLAFIQHAIDTMDEVSIVQICKSSFKEEEVCAGKALLFQSLGKGAEMPSRRRDGGEKSLQDIITLFKETDPDDVPAFVAKQLHKLPPVTFDHVDVTRLLKDITALKRSLDEVHTKLEASDKTISELRAELLLLRNTSSVSRSPAACNVNAQRGGAQNASVGSFASAEFNDSVASPVIAASEPRPSPVAPLEKSQVASTPKLDFAAVVARAPQPERQPTKGKKLIRCEPVVSAAQPEKTRCDDEGFTKVERKKKKSTSRNQCGTAALTTETMHLLRAEVPTTQLYVSRVHHTVKPEEVVEYLKMKTQLTMRVVQLTSHHNVNFKSFMVRVPTARLSTFMDAEFWPKGVLYRRFRGRLQDPVTSRSTAQLNRVN